jgi:hypothetical protein
MWKVTGASVVGTSHARSGKPCQDYYCYSTSFIGESPIILIAIADGAGSAKHSHIGSRASVEYLLQAIPRRISHPLEANCDFARAILAETAGQLNTVAADSECEVADLACTVLFSVISDYGVFLAQVGDGAWVIQRNGEYVVPIWPSNGEYINETTFLTSPDWQATLSCHFAPGEVTAIAGFTDGLERIALEWATRSAFAPFFDPLFEVLRDTSGEQQLGSGLRDLLLSDRFAARTDDDKTLVLACHQHSLMLSY